MPLPPGAAAEESAIDGDTRSRNEGEEDEGEEGEEGERRRERKTDWE